MSCGATALVVGLGIAVARELGGAWLSAVLSAFVYVLRGVPMLVLLFVVFFGLPGIGMDVPPLVAMMLSLGLISGAYLSELFRGALAAVNPNEVLAAQVDGLHPVRDASADQASRRCCASRSPEWSMS